MEGFCVKALKPLGPVQLKLAPVAEEEVRFNVCPTHIGPLLPAEGIDGITFTVATIVCGVAEQPFSEAIKEYEPLAPDVAFGIDGFCSLE